MRMRHKLLGLAMTIAALAAPAVSAVSQLSIIPVPKQATVKDGTLTITRNFTYLIGTDAAEATAEFDKFRATLGLDDTPSEGPMLFQFISDTSLGDEAYSLKVDASGVTIRASKSAGYFYALQTLKSLMGPEVMAGADTAGPWTVPFCEINDAPRYVWRGMEIDVARHFFSIDQMKKMLRVMATYKMNRLHWHLTDDQGWRLEVKKYPKLTEIASVSPNAYWMDFDTRHNYLTNEPYGPYYYTVEEMKDLVAYAKELHIEICPEIDMPGHMQAAIAAYPEFSTTPNGEHPVRYWPGVSEDILDVSNPAVVQFTKDVIDQLVDIFPYEYIHIGGDECPVTAWKNSTACQQFKKDYGLKSDRAIQNWLTKELADYAKGFGRRLICWNEVLTADGADPQSVKDADILIYAWLNAGASNNPSKQAAALGLRSVWCSTNHYYLDYWQSSNPGEPQAMGFTIDLQRIYNATPDYEASKKELYYGVNCNLWTEYVCEDKHLEYMALPRMMAVAETGWSQQSAKNFDDFISRLNRDSRYLDLAGYTYGRHYLSGDNIQKVMPKEDGWYRLVTRATNQGRADRCIELVAEGADVIAEAQATVGNLWTAPQADADASNYNWQYWQFQPDPNGSGKYAMVCRAMPEGSLNHTANGTSTGARWTYSADTKNYNFIIGEHYGQHQGQYTYSVSSDKQDKYFLSAATQGDKLSVNTWADATDGNGGIWLFDLEGFTPEAETYAPFTPIEGTVALENALNTKYAVYLQNTAGITSADTYEWCAAKALEIVESNYDSERNVQTFKLKCADSYLGNPQANAESSAQVAGGFPAYPNNLGYPLTVTASADEAAIIEMHLVDGTDNEYILTVDGKNICFISPDSNKLPGRLTAMANAVRSQGAYWKVNASEFIPFKVNYIRDGKTIRTENATRQVNDGETADDLTCPISDYRIVDATLDLTEKEGTIDIEQSQIAVFYTIKTSDGQQWMSLGDKILYGETYTPQAPEIKGFTNGRISGNTEPVLADHVLDYTVIYDTEAYPGVNMASFTISPTVGKTMLIRDAHADRNAFRCDNNGLVQGAKIAAGLAPTFVWELEDAGDGKVYIRNVGTGRYVQAVKSGETATTADKPYAFTIKDLNADAKQYTVKNGKNSYCWDGNENMDMVGWTSPGHPIEFYSFSAAPFFKVKVIEQDQDGNILSSKSQYVKPGDCYMFAAASRPGKAITSVTGNEGLDDIDANHTITITYEVEQSGINQPDLSGNTATEGIYDLNGRRLRSISQPGIYIINGIKTLIK